MIIPTLHDAWHNSIFFMTSKDWKSKRVVYEIRVRRTHQFKSRGRAAVVKKTLFSRAIYIKHAFWENTIFFSAKQKQHGKKNHYLSDWTNCALLNTPDSAKISSLQRCTRASRPCAKTKKFSSADRGPTSYIFLQNAKKKKKKKKCALCALK